MLLSGAREPRLAAKEPCSCFATGNAAFSGTQGVEAPGSPAPLTPESAAGARGGWRARDSREMRRVVGRGVPGGPGARHRPSACT